MYRGVHLESGRDPVKTAGPGHRPNRQVRHRRRITVFRPVTVQPLTFPDRELEPVRYAAVHVNCPKGSEVVNSAHLLLPNTTFGSPTREGESEGEGEREREKEKEKEKERERGRGSGREREGNIQSKRKRKRKVRRGERNRSRERVIVVPQFQELQILSSSHPSEAAAPASASGTGQDQTSHTTCLSYLTVKAEEQRGFRIIHPC